MTTKQEVEDYLEARGWRRVRELQPSQQPPPYQYLGLAKPHLTPPLERWEKSICPFDIPGLPQEIKRQDPIIVVSLPSIETTVGAWLKCLQWKQPDLNRLHCWKPEHYAYPVAISPIIERFRDELGSFGKETT
jgi:hypothetical protein